MAFGYQIPISRMVGTSLDFARDILSEQSESKDWANRSGDAGLKPSHTRSPNVSKKGAPLADPAQSYRSC